MVCDYRALNRIKISDSKPLPLIDETLDQVAGARIFSQIDLIGAYHQMRIRDLDCPKTAIRTRFGTFEWREEHKQHLRSLFKILRANKLYVRSSKCHIGVSEVDFLGYHVSSRGVSMQRRLVDAIIEWPAPTSAQECGHPVAFLSHRLSNTETNWDTGDQELLAFIIAFREWSHRWLDTLQEFSYDVEHIPGRLHTVPDALSRRPDHMKNTLSFKHMQLKDPGIINQIQEGYRCDEWAQTIITAAKIQVPNYKYPNGLLYWQGNGNCRLYVPSAGDLRQSIIHDFQKTGHLGLDKTYNFCAPQMYWPKMYQAITKFVTACKECQINKTPHSSKPGLLQPPEIPTRCWDIVTCDFLTELPKTNRGFDAILVIVDKLSKRALFEPLKNHAQRQTCFKISTIDSSRSAELNLSTAHHPQTDGQSENLIRTLSSMLRHSIQRAPNEWDTILSNFDYVYNGSKNSSTGLAPFEIDLGRILHAPMTRPLTDCTIQCAGAIETSERRKAFNQIAKEDLANARARQKFYADKTRVDLRFNEGDLVMLRTEG
ncbi:unnamed protein product [Chondrus crispus]|uniref:Integrase catalytic domain-containing protein n=1 Tax=Chondrus crispus TaxID=2769 RepID=R7QUC1_CHOCR|nr:unnamed protein product [Chondrus crispus]CDF41288.1 unnamed protein product [Chondrus crispus]|eukprot:XP_005711582.1 unnamed protein product [Chondrus crispus]